MACASSGRGTVIRRFSYRSFSWWARPSRGFLPKFLMSDGAMGVLTVFSHVGRQFLTVCSHENLYIRHFGKNLTPRPRPDMRKNGKKFGPWVLRLELRWRPLHPRPTFAGLPRSPGLVPRAALPGVDCESLSPPPVPLKHSPTRTLPRLSKKIHPFPEASSRC